IRDSIREAARSRIETRSEVSRARRLDLETDRRRSKQPEHPVDRRCELMKKRDSFYTRHEGLILGGSAVAIVVAVWEYVWEKKWVSPLFFSGPSTIAKEFWRMIQEESLLTDMAFSGKSFALG